MRVAIKYSDGVVVVSEDMPEDFQTYLKNLRKPVLYNSDKETFQDSYREFYTKILKK
jgi:starch synthase catalytic domain protein